MSKIIFQTWKTEKPTGLFKYCADSWNQHNPNWQYLYLSDIELSEVIKKINRPIYDKYEHNTIAIKRFDAYRLAFIYEYGGLYADIDIVCHKNIESLIKNNNAILFNEYPCNDLQTVGAFYLNQLLTNSIFYFKPKHRFLKRILNDLTLYTQKSLVIANDESSQFGIDVITETGPIFLTVEYNKYKKLYPDINILSHHAFELYDKKTRQEMTLNRMLKINKDVSYGTHLNVGSWCMKDSWFRYYDSVEKYDSLSVMYDI